MTAGTASSWKAAPTRGARHQKELHQQAQLYLEGVCQYFCNTKFPEAAREDPLRPEGPTSFSGHRADSGMSWSVPAQLPTKSSQNPMEWTEDLTMIIHSILLLKNPSGLFCVVELRPNLLFICPLVTTN